MKCDFVFHAQIEPVDSNSEDKDEVNGHVFDNINNYYLPVYG